MFRLSREVRFAISAVDDTVAVGSAANGFGGNPAMTGLAHYFSLEVTLAGEPDPSTGCLVNIKEIDEVVRRDVIPMAAGFIRRGRTEGGAAIAQKTFDLLSRAWPHAPVHHIRLGLSPSLTLSVFAKEHPTMTRVSQKFEFCAAHRLHNPALSDDENQRRFGKCNNPHGHGHNYVVQVTLAGPPDATGHIMPLPEIEAIVGATIIEPFDHKNLNTQIEEFGQLIPSVENIAKVIYQRLRPKFEGKPGKLAGVTVWESARTWCEYME